MKRAALAALIVIPLAAIVYWYILDSFASRDLESAIAGARAAGIATSYADPYYQEWDGDNAMMLLPDNAAWYYTEGYNLYNARLQARRGTTGLKDPDYRTLPIIGHTERAIELKDPLPRETAESMRVFVADNADVFDLIHRGAAMEKCRFRIRWDGPFTLLPHLTHTRALARLVALEMWTYAEDNRPSDAVALVPDGLALGRALAQEPLAISSLVSYAAYSIILTTGVERVLARTKASNADLAALQVELTRAADSLSSRQAVASEIASVMDIYERISEGRPLIAVDQGGQPQRYAKVRDRLLFWLERGPIKRDFARKIRLLQLAASAQENPPPEMLTPGYLGPMDAELASYRFEVSGLQGWNSISEVVLTCERTRSRFRSAVACVAALRYRNDRGKWPETLDYLVPEYLASVPLDPFTGKPLYYKVTDTGITAYSTGQNLTDDGGVFELYSPANPADPKSAMGTADDTGFRIWKPDAPPQ